MIHIKATFYFENSRGHSPGFILQNSDGSYVSLTSAGNLIMVQPSSGNNSSTWVVDGGYISSGNQCYMGNNGTNETKITGSAPVTWDVFISRGSSFNHLSGITIRAQCEWKTSSGMASGIYVNQVSGSGAVQLSNIRNIGFRNGDATYTHGEIFT